VIDIVYSLTSPSEKELSIRVAKLRPSFYASRRFRAAISPQVKGLNSC